MLAAPRHLEPSKPFRGAWQYNNLMYLVAGMVLERVSRERWDDFIRPRILMPLGMERATTSLEDMLAQHPDYAMPHAVLDGEQRRIPVTPIYARPAGSICASIAEMAAWMRFHLDPVTGRGGLRLSSAASAELTAPQIYTARSDFAEIGPLHYGFGFFVGHYRGARCIDHGGGPWFGYNCDPCLLPGHGRGVMVTNGLDPGCAPLTNAVLDHLLGLEPLPWLDRFRGPSAERREHSSKDWSVRPEAHRHVNSPSHALADYTNEYAHPAHRKVRITCDGNALRWEGLGLDLPMIHRHRDVFETVPERDGVVREQDRAIRHRRRGSHREPGRAARAGSGADRLPAPPVAGDGGVRLLGATSPLAEVGPEPI